MTSKSLGLPSWNCRPLDWGTGNDSRGHCCKSQLDDGEDEHPDRYKMNIRVYLGENFVNWDQIVTLFVTPNSLFVNQMTKNTIFYGIYCNNWKITTYPLGEHDWLTSKWEDIKQNVEPCILYSSLPEIACKTVRPFKPEFRERWQLLEFSFSSRKPRLDQGNSRSRLEAWEWR